MNEIIYNPSKNLEAIEGILMNINNPTYRLVRNNKDSKMYFFNETKKWIQIKNNQLPIYLNPLMKKMKLFVKDKSNQRDEYVEFQQDGKKLKTLVYSLIPDNLPFYDVPDEEEK